MKKTKVCMVASCGGHIMELMQLLPVVEGKDYYFVTEKNVASKGLMAKHKHYYLKQQQRRGEAFIFILCGISYYLHFTSCGNVLLP